MFKQRRLSLLIAILIGLVAFAQLPRAINICHGADGALRTGLGCQCPACGPAISTLDIEGACGCGDVACSDEQAGATPDATLAGNTCCAGFKLTYQLTTMRSPLPKLELLPQLLQSLLASTPCLMQRVELLPCKYVQLGHPPGPSQTSLLRTVILRA